MGGVGLKVGEWGLCKAQRGCAEQESNKGGVCVVMLPVPRAQPDVYQRKSGDAGWRVGIKVCRREEEEKQKECFALGC